MGNTLLVSIPALISGLLWCTAYIGWILKGIKDRHIGLPFFALAFNISFELLYCLRFTNEHKGAVQTIIMPVWLLLDFYLLFLYIRHGRKDFFPGVKKKLFPVWSVIVFLLSFLIVYSIAFELGDTWGGIYVAFGQNLMMSILFLQLLVHRSHTKGQSQLSAWCKFLGTLIPLALGYWHTGNLVILVFGIGIFCFDMLYIVMLSKKIAETRV